MSNAKDYYVFARPNAMVGHKFSDDAAICRASDFEEALQIFSKYYADVQPKEVWKLSDRINDESDFAILTDY